MITAVIDAGQHYCQAVSDLWQWDYGQTLRIQGVKLPAAVEVQFSTTERIGETVTRIGVTQEGVTEVPIPDTLLEGGGTTQDYTIYAFVYIENGDSGKTEYRVSMKVRARPKPEAHATPEEGELFRQAIATVSESADRAESARKSAETAADKAESAKNAAESASGSAQTSADEAKTAKENAETAAKVAEAFKTEAETAKNDAVQAKEAAEKAKSGTAADREVAEAASKAAQVSAISAEKSAERAETAKEEIQESADQIQKNATEIDSLKENLGGIDSLIYSNITKGSAILNNSWNRVELVEGMNLYYGKTYRFELDFDSVVVGSAYLYIVNGNNNVDIVAYKTTGDKTFDISYTPNKDLANIKLQVAGMYTGHCECRVFDDEFDTEIEKIKNELSAINKKTSIKHGFLLGDMPKYEKQIISISTGADDSFGPQGIATDGRYLFITNGSGYVRKINIATKEYTDNLIGYYLLKHANSCDYNSNDNTVYICANGGSNNNNKVVVIDADTLSVKRIYTLVDNNKQPIYPHGIAIDQLNNHFYVTNSFRTDNVIKLREFDKNGQYIGELEFNNDVFSKYTGYGSTQQGIGFDGTYFYVPLHSVGYVVSYDCILIFDRLGNYVRTQTALKNLEIEDICYDYSNNRLFANYGHGGNFITEFVDDSGWLNLTDFVESGIDNIVSSDAKIKIKNGIFYTQGSIKVTNSGDIFRLSSRVSPHNNKVSTLCAYSEDDNFINSKLTRVKWSSYTDTYDMQLNYAVYCPNKGTIWLEGGCVPM